MRNEWGCLIFSSYYSGIQAFIGVRIKWKDGSAQNRSWGQNRGENRMPGNTAVEFKLKWSCFLSDRSYQIVVKPHGILLHQWSTGA